MAPGRRQYQSRSRKKGSRIVKQTLTRRVPLAQRIYPVVWLPFHIFPTYPVYHFVRLCQKRHKHCQFLAIYLILSVDTKSVFAKSVIQKAVHHVVVPAIYPVPLKMISYTLATPDVQCFLVFQICKFLIHILPN